MLALKKYNSNGARVCDAPLCCKEKKLTQHTDGRLLCKFHQDGGPHGSRVCTAAKGCAFKTKVYNGRWVCEQHIRQMQKWSDVVNENGDSICHAYGCRRSAKLSWQFEGGFCPEHIPQLARIRHSLVACNDNELKMRLLAEEAAFRKQPITSVCVLQTIPTEQAAAQHQPQRT